MFLFTKWFDADRQTHVQESIFTSCGLVKMQSVIRVFSCEHTFYMSDGSL